MESTLPLVTASLVLPLLGEKMPISKREVEDTDLHKVSFSNVHHLGRHREAQQMYLVGSNRTISLTSQPSIFFDLPMYRYKVAFDTWSVSHISLTE